MRKDPNLPHEASVTAIHSRHNKTASQHTRSSSPGQVSKMAEDWREAPREAPREVPKEVPKEVLSAWGQNVLPRTSPSA